MTGRRQNKQKRDIHTDTPPLNTYGHITITMVNTHTSYKPTYVESSLLMFSFSSTPPHISNMILQLYFSKASSLHLITILTDAVPYFVKNISCFGFILKTVIYLGSTAALCHTIMYMLLVVALTKLL